MKFLVFLVLCFKGSLSSLCDGNFWNCTDGTAEFDVTAFTNAGFGPGGGFTTLTAKFEPSIKNVKFDTKDVKLGIMKLEGKNVQDIVMSGNITLEDLCPLLRTETALPSLKTVRLVNVHIHGFNFSQDCSNDELFAPLQDPVPNSVEVTKC